MSTPKVDHIAINGRRLRRLKDGLDKMIRSARDAHWRAEIYFHCGNLDGAKMRNLDDLVMQLEDARKEIREYLRPIK
jgi:hypothetical protein